VDLELDSSGYPTDKTLDLISEYRNGVEFKDLIDAIKPLWAYADAGYWRVEGDEYHLSTAGWSGNEDIISALRNNFVFWGLCWVSSRRGGHHVFRVKGNHKEKG
jgi:hypothetical protein